MTSSPAERGTRTWPPLLAQLLRGADLEPADTAWAMDQVMLGEATPVQVAGFVVALRAKGETPGEIAGLVDAMLAHARRISVPGIAVDTCGTGGDGAHTVNISTMAAVVVAGAGARVVKHGNRAASSRSGSADLLEALGVVVDLEPGLVAECVETAGIGFCFAPLFHPALRFASVPRRELGVPTVFNILGPLANPAQPAAQAVGVSDLRLAGVMAHVLARRGTSALVFRGEDGLDELTVSAVSRVWEVSGGAVTETLLAPEDVGIARSPADALRGGDADHNAEVARRVLAGESGPVRDAVLLNAAAALVAIDGAGPGETDGAPLSDRMVGALARATKSLDSGAASTALDRWVATSRDLAGTRSPS